MNGPVFLVARRDYFAYVGAWGFWASLILGPLLIAVLMFGPVLLARAEPPRLIAILAERTGDAAIVAQVFADKAREDARGDIGAYVEATAPALTARVLAAFDAAHNRAEGVRAARAIVATAAPQALRAFPAASPRYIVTPPPAADLDGVKPYLDRRRLLSNGGSLYGLIYLRRDANGLPAIEYWSTNLSHQEPSVIARQAMRVVMQREALVGHGLDSGEAQRIEELEPTAQQFDPRPSAPQGRITLRQRAPFYAALALSFILWSVVFSTGNMLLSSVIEEKSNKILDTLLTSVSPLELLLGKLLGVAAVSATLFLFWGALGGVLLNFAAARMSDSILGQLASGFLDPKLLAAFLIGFVAGYLMYGAIFLALGSLCESIQEAQTLLGPVALVLSMPMMLIAPALDNPNAPIIQAASWAPIFTPFLMLIRAPGGLDWVTIAGQGALMVLCVVVVLMAAARIFRAGVVDQVSMSNWRKRKT